MIYSRSCEYAIRAFVHLAQLPDGECALVKNIALNESIPAHFLAKILQEMARKGLLRSNKGPTGGFCLAVPAREIRLIDIVKTIDGAGDFERCVAGLPVCSDARPCAQHAEWTSLRSRIVRYLERNTIASLARTFEQNRRVLQKSNTVDKRVSTRP
ncbi:MAG: Rrf2 family transcriptional regulator [Acidobacteriota bacterium]|nr:Rrf2 family transcriptional regulator [Acidobacteriota bacterium]